MNLKVITLLFLLITINVFSQDEKEMIEDAKIEMLSNDSLQNQEEMIMELPLMTRKRLTGKWEGLRLKLKEKGVKIGASITSFYQGIIDGYQSDHDFEGGSHASLSIMLDGEKIGLWKGFFMVGKTDYNIGHSVNGKGNVLLPVNMAMAYPGIDGGDRFDVNFYFIQFFSPKKKLILGKLNMADMTNFSNFKGGSGKKTFQNISYITTPNGITTPSVFGGFFQSEGKVNYTLATYDANNTLNRSGLEEPFKDGVTFYGSIDVPLKIKGKSGKQGVFGVYTTKDFINFKTLKSNVISGLPPENVDGRYSFGYYFEQMLGQSTVNEKKKWGVFGQAMITDSKATPSDWGVMAGLGGSGLFRQNAMDSWGVGYFKFSLLDELEGFNAGSLLGNSYLMQDAEEGFEVFYDNQLTPWFSLGIDFQYVNPGGSSEEATFLGFRNMIKF